ncbi:FAD-dependent oxidoreductase [Thalassococcus sp. BH17M4-6]|uniref:FAD-dependent oxidoreductase n=1 Tax=Thalassococcus sp. BH17M4-6 TaxID=3413148 RepID=UPI003BE44E73
MRELKIAVAGAGIGGLAVAAGCAWTGHEVTVFDRFDAPAPVGSGLVIQPVGQAVLDWLGAMTPARAMGAQIYEMRGHEAENGRPVLNVRYGPHGGGRFGLAIHRAALFDALLAAARSAGADLRPGHSVTRTQGGRLWFENKAAAGPFDLVVNATGAGSVLSPLVAKPLPYGAVWATVDWPDTTLPRDALRQVYRRADRMIGVLPIGQVPGAAGRKAAIFWSLPTQGHDAWLARGLDVWRAEAASLWPDFAPFAAQITDPGQMTMARYSHGTLANPVADRLAHIGDAAHRASPQLGQGANMALLDAQALVLALDHSRGDVPLALSQYRRARRWHVRVYQGMSRAFTPQYQSDSRWLPVLRDRLLFPLSQVPPVPRLLTRLVCGDMLPPLGTLQVGS